MKQTLKKERRFANPYSRTKGGKREDLNDTYFRSKWEANFARYLNLLRKCGNIHDWRYEVDTFEFHEVKRGIRSYTPDFKVWNDKDSEPYYYEVKGWMDKKSKTKLNRMAKYYPQIKIIIIDEKQYKSIAKKCRHLISEWE